LLLFLLLPLLLPLLLLLPCLSLWYCRLLCFLHEAQLQKPA
jgi:hypothetical protein